MDTEKIREILASVLNDTLSEKERQIAASRAQAEMEAKLTQLEETQRSLVEKDAELAALSETLTTVKSELEHASTAKQVCEDESAALRAALAEKDAAMLSLVAEKDGLVEKVSVVTAELAESQTMAQALKEAMDAINAEKLLASRLDALKTASVLRAGAALDAQKSLVVSLSEEDFVAYVADLVALRGEIVASLSTTTTTAPVVTELDLTTKPADSKAIGEAIAKLVMKRAK